MCPKPAHNLYQSHRQGIHAAGSENGHMARIAMSFPGTKSRAGHVFRVEAFGKIAAEQGRNSKNYTRNFVKSMLMQALHAVAGAGAAYPGTY